MSPLWQKQSGAQERQKTAVIPCPQKQKSPASLPGFLDALAET